MYSVTVISLIVSIRVKGAVLMLSYNSYLENELHTSTEDFHVMLTVESLKFMHEFSMVVGTSTA